VEKETYQAELSEFVGIYNKDLAELIAKLSSLYINNIEDVSVDYLDDLAGELSILEGDMCSLAEMQYELAEDYTELVDEFFEGEEPSR
jgi:hypothetical protein